MDIPEVFLQSAQQATILGVAGYFARNWLDAKLSDIKKEVEKLNKRIDRVDREYLVCQKELPTIYATKKEIDKVETKLLKNCTALSRHSERLYAVVERVKKLENGHDD